MQRARDKKKRAVLVIDSDLTKADRLKNLLNEKGFSAYTAGTLSEALMLAEEKQVVVVFLAIGRPDLDSRRLITSLKKRKEKVEAIIPLY